MFEAGALIFRIQTVGQQVFQQDQRAAKDSFEKTGKAAADAGKQVDESGNATDRTAKKARDSKKPLDDQAKATEEVGKKSKSSSQEQEKQADSTERQIDTAKRLAAGLLIAGTAVTALVGLSVAKFTEFDKAMSQTAAASMATAEEQRDLGEAALQAGADTAYSASEAAAAQEELVKAGQSVSEVVGGSLNGALGLAAAGQLAVARSAEIMATTLTQFKLPATDAARVADVLAAGAGKAQGSVEDMGLAMSYVGPLAASFGWSLEETAGTIAYFSTQGIIGEKAGTALRGVLAALQAPSAAASGVMKEYGISVFDASGEMLGAAGIAEQLRTKLGGLTEQERLAALGRIFGNESLLGATLLYEGGAEAVNKMTAEVTDYGYATEQAAMRQDNLAGDVEKLGGSFDTALIRTGSGANEVLRAQVQLLTQLIDWYGELPAPVQATALVFGVATGAALLLAGAAVTGRAKFMELKLQMDATNLSLGRTALLGGAAGLALTGVITVVALLAQAQADARARAQSYADALRDGGESAKAAARDLVAANLSAKTSFLWMEGDSVYDAAKKLGLSIDLVTDAAEGNADAQRKLREQLEFGGYGTDEFKAKLDELGLTTADYTGLSTQVTEAIGQETAARERGKTLIEQQTEATDESAASSETAAAAYLESADAVGDLESELQQLIDTINAANGVGQDAVSANISYQDALAKVDETIARARAGEEGYTLTLDQNTQVGRDNLGMLNDMAQRSQEAADAQFALDGNTDSYRATLEAGRQALIDRAQQMGYNADEAARLADQIYRIPSQTEWQVIAETQRARVEMEGFFTSYNGRRINVIVDANGGERYRIAGTDVMYQADGGVVEFFAGGGILAGSSGGTEATVTRMVAADLVTVFEDREVVFA